MSKRMQSRIALITGGGTGMGAAIASLFAKEGARVAIIGRREAPLQKTKEQIQAEGFEAIFYCGDVSKISDVKKVIENVNQRFGPIDALVNSAGVINSQPEDIIKMNSEEWDFLMNINIKGVFHTTKFFIENLIANSRKGTIVNISSICAHQGCPEYATYSASKGAVSAYTKAVAAKYGHYGIRVNSVSPGVVHTPMSYVEMENFDSMIDEFNKEHPLGRIGNPEDVAYAVLYLSCEESSWITGQDLIVDGGWTLGK